MTQYRLIAFTVFVICWNLFTHATAIGEEASLYHSVEKALEYSPQLKALRHGHTALEHDLDQARRLRRPSIDLTLGQGLEQHSDEKTRETGADPSDNDWDSKSDVSIKLIQKLYDGGETRSQISIQQALLDTSHYRIQAATQAIILDAISAHFDVYMQRKLLELTKNNLKIHQDIYELLVEREQAGAGDITDVNQTSARMAGAQSIVFAKKADLRQARANYARIVGTAPGNLTYAEDPTQMPDTLEDALKRTEENNPELLALSAGIEEVEARVRLARSPYKPRINFELGSSYNDNLEGSHSWQNTNEAMVVLRWNLYNGGQDRARLRTARSRKQERRANQKDMLLHLREATTAAWSTYRSLQQQTRAYSKAAKYSRSTFEAYMNQFNISKRSLLDVLNAENDFYQAASQLVTATVKETLEAYRLLNLGGALEPSSLPRYGKDSVELRRLSESVPLSLSDTVISTDIDALTEDRTGHQPAASIAIKIGPFVNKLELERTEKYLQGRGVNFRRMEGSGKVNFYRLLEGEYPPAEARKRLKILKESGHAAFVIPQRAKMALFLGSFHRQARAQRFKDQLEQDNITVEIIEQKIETRGTLLIVPHVEPDAAEAIAKRMVKAGFPVEVNGNDTQ